MFYLYDQIGTDKEGNPLQFVDIIEADGQDILSCLEQKEDLGKLRDIMPALLNKRELYVITKRYGMDDGQPRTKNEVAAKLGISRSYVSRLEKRALGKLQKHLKK